jgi:lipopolysaccharide export system ATP-binding protein
MGKVVSSAPVDSVARSQGRAGAEDRLAGEGLVKSFKGRTVVKGVRLDVTAGEIVGLLGPNGAGKTTIFDMMVGLCQPDAGTIGLESRS